MPVGRTFLNATSDNIPEAFCGRSFVCFVSLFLFALLMVALVWFACAMAMVFLGEEHGWWRKVEASEEGSYGSFDTESEN
jgi:uncharacterized membrane protein